MRVDRGSLDHSSYQFLEYSYLHDVTLRIFYSLKLAFLYFYLHRQLLIRTSQRQQSDLIFHIRSAIHLYRFPFLHGPSSGRHVHELPLSLAQSTSTNIIPQTNKLEKSTKNNSLIKPQFLITPAPIKHHKKIDLEHNLNQNI